MKSFCLDPRTKLVLIVVINLVMVTDIPCWFESIIVSFCVLLLFLSQKSAAAFKYMILFLVMIAGEKVLMPVTSGGVQVIIGLFSMMFRKFLPLIIILHLVISTTRVSEFSAAMEKMHVPKEIIIPFSVMFRFFPTVHEEWDAIRDAMKMRGIGISAGNMITEPIHTLEYILVPLLNSTVRIGEELSAASLARGLDTPEGRTNFCRIGWSGYDLFAIAACVILLLLSAGIGSFIL